MLKKQLKTVEEYHQKRFVTPLEGGTVIGLAVCQLEDEPEFIDDYSFGIVVECKDGKQRMLYPMRDPEGNGAGHMELHTP